MTGVERCFQYCKDVEDKKIKTNKYIKLAVKRFRDDLKKSKKKDYPYYFDEGEANRFIAFAECLKQYKDAFRGMPLILEPWQCFIFSNVYGWKEKETKVRRFKIAYVFVARKNGKSTMMAATLLYDILTTPGAEAYCAATKREQSRIILDTVREMVKQNEGLNSRLKYFNSTSRIINQKLAGKIEALSSDSKTMDGLNPSCVVVDELAAMKNFDTINVLHSGQGARQSPLLFEITSGSDDIHSAGRQEFEKSAKILEGSFENDEYFTVLYCIDEEDDWRDSSNDIKANPNLGVSVFQKHLDTSRTEAMQQPAKEGEFRSKCLGQWVSPITSWINFRTWNKCCKPVNKLEGSNIVVGAVDLSKRHDFSAYTIYTYNVPTRKYYAKHKFYIPDEQIDVKMKRDSPMIRKWIEQGYITATRGPIIDYRTIYRDILSSIDEYSVREICFDPYNAATLINEVGPSIDLIQVNQNMKNMSPMSKDWEAAILNNEIIDNNPVMKWMVSGCSIYVDPNGNIKPIKTGGADSTNRIDGVVTSIMAFGRIKELLKEGVDLRTPEEIELELAALFDSMDY